MYAIIETGGKEYSVEVGSKIQIEKLDGNRGEEIVFDKVLLIADNDDVMIGKPYLSGAKVVGEIAIQTKGKKIIVFKRRPKKAYKRKLGHRQPITEVKIKDIVKQ